MIPAISPTPRIRGLAGESLGWAQENLINSPARAAGLLVLAAAAGWVTQAQWRSAPALAGTIAGLWLVGLAAVVASAVRHQYTPLTQWLKERLYASAASALVTLIISLLLAAAARGLLNWAVLQASFATDPAVAKASQHAGATWGIVLVNLKLFMVYQFDPEQLWRVWAAAGLLLALSLVSLPAYGLVGPGWPRRARQALTWAWTASPLVFWALLRGLSEEGFLATIQTRTWGGLLFTLIISVFAIVASFPLGVLLALGRRSTTQGVPAWLTYPVVAAIAAWGLVTYTWPGWPLARTALEYVLLLWPAVFLLAGLAFQRFFKGNVVSAFCTLYIEFVRGVPLITVLFMAQLMLPLFLPSDIIIENAFRAMWGFMLFSAAYLAENVRGGLQSVPKGQYEAAQSLGLNTFQELRFIILPQALRVVIPPIIGQFIGLFKDTSLVAIVGLFDLLHIANAVVAQPDWLGLRLESYVFITSIYYLGCAFMALVGRWLEKKLGVGVR